ncbi:MAG: AMP-binding protein, partial [Polyangiaceae bacterium]
MSFSIFDAATDSGPLPALVIDGTTLSFSDLAQAVAPVCTQLAELTTNDATPIALRVAPRRGTLLAVYALLEKGTAFVPIHPRLAEVEAKQLAADLNASALLDEAALAGFEREHSSSISLEKNRLNCDRTLAIVFTSGT